MGGKREKKRGRGREEKIRSLLRERQGRVVVLKARKEEELVLVVVGEREKGSFLAGREGWKVLTFQRVITVIWQIDLSLSLLLSLSLEGLTGRSCL